MRRWPPAGAGVTAGPATIVHVVGDHGPGGCVITHENLRCSRARRGHDSTGGHRTRRAHGSVPAVGPCAGRGAQVYCCWWDESAHCPNPKLLVRRHDQCAHLPGFGVPRNLEKTNARSSRLLRAGKGKIFERAAKVAPITAGRRAASSVAPGAARAVDRLVY